MKRANLFFLLIPLSLIPLSGCVAIAAQGAGPTRAIARTYTAPDAWFARTLTIPAGYDIVRLPGMIADPVTPANGDTPADYGDTERQADNILTNIAGVLGEAGLDERDVVAMTAYLEAPSRGGVMDFAGFNRAYARHYGSASQPNRPVRSTVQVAGVAGPGMLVEIEVTAARKPR